MSVNSTVSVVKATATASQTLFSISTIEFFKTTEITVYKDSVLQASGFTVDVDNQTVTFTTPMTGGELLVFQRVLPLTQLITYTVQGKFPAASHEEGLDRLVMLLQEREERLDRGIEIPVTHTATSWTTTLPDPGLAANKGKALRIKSDGTGIETFTVDTSDTLNVLTTRGDLIRGGVGGVAERVALGASGTILESDGTDAVWGTAATKKATLTTKGDIYAASATSTPARLAVGSNYTLLGADSGEAAGLKYMQVQPFQCVKGLRIDYAASVTDQAVITAKEVTLWNPTTGETYTTNVTTDITLDIDETQAGSVANQRDQASAFGATATIHVYYIWNGTTLATLASIAGGDAFNPWTTGPTLPSGYTHYCYLGTTIGDGSGEFVRHHQRGCRIYRGTATAMLSGGSATSFTAINQGTWVPQTAMNFEINVSDFGGTRSGSGQADFQVQLSIDATNIYANLRGFFDGLGASNNSRFAGASFTLPNYDATGTAVQQFWYRVVNTLGTSCSTTINIGSFTVPNGDN